MGLTVWDLNGTINEATRKMELKIGNGISQPHQNPWVDEYWYILDPATSSLTGWSPGLGPNQNCFVV
jgi:hypothetical protein